MELLEEVKDKKKAICRVCLSFEDGETGRGMSLFEKHNNVYVYEKINYISSIEIKQEDNLPDRICSTCLLALENACIFKQQCESSDTILHSSLKLGELHKQFIEIPIKEEVNEYEFDYCETYSPLCQTTDSKLESKLITEQNGVVSINNKDIDLKLECHDCGGNFKSKCKLRVHWKKVHLLQQLICPFCKKTHKSYKSYHNHMKKRSKGCLNAAKIRVEGEGKNRVYHCKECDAKSKRIQTIMTHIVTHTGERPYPCNMCNKTFTQISSLRGHKECSHNLSLKEGTCHLCGKYIKGRNRWYKHMKNHANVQLPCSVCNKVFASKATLNIHMKRHSDIKSFTCEICAKTFYVSSDLRNHKVKTHFKNKIYHCQECNYKTLNFTTMSRHRNRHTGNNLACEVCGTFLENEQQLELHKKRHFEKNFKCSICGKLYYSRKNLTAHIRKVHNLYGVGLLPGRKAVKVELKRDSQSV